MDYRYLKAFLVASRHENFTKAALELKIAPSALLRQIDLFEESLGQDCFERKNKKIKLNLFGRQVYERATEFEEANLRHQKNKPGTIENWLFAKCF